MAKKNSGKSVQTIPLQYDLAEDVEKLAKPIISQHHTHLVNSKIAYLFRNKPMKKAGRNVAATAEKVSAKNKVLSGYDFIITISYETWKTLSDQVRTAILDHELAHCFVDDDEKTGEPKFVILPHTIEEFSEVVLRRGLYTIDLIHMGAVFETAKIPDDLQKNVVLKKLGDPDSEETENEEEQEEKPKKKGLKVKKTKTDEDENLLDLE